MPKDIDEMNLRQYAFVNGNGDSKHENEINEFDLKGYRVVNVCANPRAIVDSINLLVLMHREV
jgi:hypothetical protein